MNSRRSSSSPFSQGEQYPPFASTHPPSGGIAQAAEPGNELPLHWSGLITMVTITLATVVGTALWVLNSLNVLYISWAGVIAAILSAISILLSLWPLRSQSARRSHIQVVDSTLQSSSSAGKSSLWTRKKRGILYVRVGKPLRHATIILHHGFDQAHGQPLAAAGVAEQLIKGEAVYIATFPSVEPGNYTVATQGMKHTACVTVYAGLSNWASLQCAGSRTKREGER